MKKSTKYILYLSVPIVLVVALVVRGMLVSDDTQDDIGPEPQRVQTSDTRLPVRAVVAATEPFSNRIFATGTAIANEEVMLRPEVSGRITTLNIREGMRVGKGELLLRLNDADLQAELLRAQLQLELAQIREQRQKALLENRAIAREDYDVALNAVNTLKAEIQLIEARIEKMQIRAPFDGYIGLRNVSAGAYVTPSDVVASLQDFSRVRIDFSIPERHSGQIAEGDRIRFTRQGSDETYNGRVIAVEPRIDANTRTLRLRAEADNRNAAIIPGAFVEIELQLREIPDAILIPTEAVIPELGGHSVFVARDGKAVRKQIQTGIRTETRVQIAEGIVPGDTVLTTGILQLREQLPVRITTTE